MNLDWIIAECLLETHVGTLRGVQALLAFWRAWRHAIPRYAGLSDDCLRDLEHARRLGLPSADADLADFHRRRATWDRLAAILDAPDDRAVDALYALVNGPDALDLVPFYIVPAFLKPPKDRALEDYLRHFQAPFERHVRRRLEAAACSAQPTAAGPGALTPTPPETARQDALRSGVKPSPRNALNRIVGSQKAVDENHLVHRLGRDGSRPYKTALDRNYLDEFRCVCPARPPPSPAPGRCTADTRHSSLSTQHS